MPKFTGWKLWKLSHTKLIWQSNLHRSLGQAQEAQLSSITLTGLASPSGGGTVKNVIYRTVRKKIKKQFHYVLILVMDRVNPEHFGESMLKTPRLTNPISNAEKIKFLWYRCRLCFLLHFLVRIFCVKSHAESDNVILLLSRPNKNLFSHVKP